MFVAALLVTFLTLYSVNGQQSCLSNGLNDISRRDPVCASQIEQLNSQLDRSMLDIPQSVLDEVCSASCWDQYSRVVQRCGGSNVSIVVSCIILQCSLKYIAMQSFTNNCHLV